MEARRGTRIEWFSDCCNHGGGLFTLLKKRSQASRQHFKRDITPVHRMKFGVSAT
jgi:hypothetical protein